MAWLNQQMNFPVGVRTSVNGITNEQLDAILIGVDWTNFKLKFVSNLEYGNTKFNDFSIIAYYFKHRLIMHPAAVDLGYADGPGTASSFLFRLKRINIESMLNIVRMLIKYGLITFEDVLHILTDPVHLPSDNTRGTHKAYNSIMYKFVAKRLVTESITKFGGRRKAAKKLHVKLAIVTHWADMEVIDPMVKYVQKEG